MKKKICLLLTGIIFLTAGCGNNSGLSDETGNTEKATTAQESEMQDSGAQDAEDQGFGENEENNEGDAADESTDSADTSDTAENDAVFTDDSAKEVSDIPLYVVLSDYDNDMEEIDGEYTNLYDGSDEELRLHPDYSDIYPGLDKSLKELSDQGFKDFKTESEEYKSSAREALSDDYFPGAYQLQRSIGIQRTDAKVLSFISPEYTYMGGAHGGYGIDAYSFDVSTGEALKITDIINIDEETFDGILYDKLKNYNEQFAEDGYLESYGDPKETLKNYTFDAQISSYDEENDKFIGAYTWYLGMDGLHTYFEVYTFASYADGATNLLIGYDEMPEIFNEKYLPEDNVSFMTEMGRVFGKKMDIDGDGEEEIVTIDFIYDNDNYDYSVGLSVEVDGIRAETEDEYFYADEGMKIYHVRTDDNRNYLYIRTGGMDDYYSWEIFDLTGDSVKFAGVVYFTEAYVDNIDGGESGGQLCKTDPNNMVFGERTDAFGTLTFKTYWHVGEDGLPEENDIRRKVMYPGAGASSKTELTLDVVDEDGNIVEEDVLIPAGEKFEPYASDLETYMDLKLSDGRIVRLIYTDMKSYPVTIDGKNIEEFFDNLMYAG